MNPYVRQIVLPLVTALIWGLAFVAQSISAGLVEPFTFNAARSFVSVIVLGLGLLIIRLVRGTLAKKPEPGSRKTLLIAGLLCGIAMTVACNLQQAGLAETSAGKAGFLTALYIVLVPVCGLFLKKKVSLNVWISVVIAVFGLFFLCLKKGEFSIQFSDLLEILCALFFTFQILLVDHFAPRVSGVALSLLQFLVCGVISAVLAALFETVDWSLLLQAAMPILYAGALSGAVGYTLQIIAQKGSNPAVVSLLMSMESVFAAIGGALILHEVLAGREYFGCFLMLVAIILAQIPMRYRQRTAV